MLSLGSPLMAFSNTIHSVSGAGLGALIFLSITGLPFASNQPSCVSVVSLTPLYCFTLGVISWFRSLSVLMMTWLSSGCLSIQRAIRSSASVLGFLRTVALVLVLMTSTKSSYTSQNTSFYSFSCWVMASAISL